MNFVNLVATVFCVGARGGGGAWVGDPFALICVVCGCGCTSAFSVARPINSRLGEMLTIDYLTGSNVFPFFFTFFIFHLGRPDPV